MNEFVTRLNDMYWTDLSTRSDEALRLLIAQTEEMDRELDPEDKDDLRPSFKRVIDDANKILIGRLCKNNSMQ